jgi:hypothetical protein
MLTKMIERDFPNPVITKRNLEKQAKDEAVVKG